ncbi:MAG: DNA polymerase III subunit gamma/tau, partial [Lachnospiraceae bacterium]|nr:DNA polymerase III subunit gamma/tau [Lachnospiraceae bacterium]
YRKFRPTDFSEVKGQDHIVKTLQNQIKTDRIGHAYLFTGTRGTGKTTVAKILSKAVNCEHLQDGNPCNECAICSNINSGASVNVREIDAASNNSVENIRQIIEEVQYPPTEGRYKVYIIDEVHMLSAGAFNALLKTLEEPPEYVIFILATTEIGKIPVTITSRCQRYDFHRITIETIAKRLRELCDREGIKAEDKAINYIAKAADGSMRDALSLLDQCVAFYLGEELTFDNVLTCLGVVDTQIFSRLLRCIINKDVAGTLDIIDEVIKDGKEIGQFITDFTWYLRNIILIRSSSDMADVIDVSSENMKLLEEEAKLVKDEEVIRYIRILSELNNEIRYSNTKRVLVEIGMIKLCKPAIAPDVDEIMVRLEELEDQVANGVKVAAVSMGNANAAPAPTATAAPKEVPKALPEDIKNVINNWKNIVTSIEDHPIKTAFLRAKLNVTEDNGNLVIVLNKDKLGNDELYAAKLLTDPKTNEEAEVKVKETLESTIERVIGKRVNIVVREQSNIHTGHTLDPRKEFKSPVVDNLNFDVDEE